MPWQVRWLSFYFLIFKLLYQFLLNQPVTYMLSLTTSSLYLSTSNRSTLLYGPLLKWYVIL